MPQALAVFPLVFAVFWHFFCRGSKLFGLEVRFTCNERFQAEWKKQCITRFDVPGTRVPVFFGGCTGPNPYTPSRWCAAFRASEPAIGGARGAGALERHRSKGES